LPPPLPNLVCPHRAFFVGNANGFFPSPFFSCPVFCTTFLSHPKSFPCFFSFFLPPPLVNSHQSKVEEIPVFPRGRGRLKSGVFFFDSFSAGPKVVNVPPSFAPLFFLCNPPFFLFFSFPSSVFLIRLPPLLLFRTPPSPLKTRYRVSSAPYTPQPSNLSPPPLS